MIALPSNLPNVAHAKLPVSYEAAKNALAQCSQIDECQQWADKMEALASYARQSEDDTLRRMCDRIQARAIRRCGELLKQIEPKNGANQNIQAGARPEVTTRTSAARDAGLSPHQAKTALRVANVPDEEFEDAIEADEPATVTALAERGKKPAPKPLVDLGGISPQDFAISTQGQGRLREFADFCGKTIPASVARGAQPHETAAMRRHIATIDAWLDQLSVSLMR